MNYLTSFFSGSKPKETDEERSVREKQSLMIGLKLSITKMIKLSTSKGDEPITFDDSYQEVSTLLSSIEKCVFHEIKLEEFNEVFPFWGLLERMEAFSEQVREAIVQIFPQKSLKSPLARSRAWLRLALNRGVLQGCIDSIKSNAKVSYFFSRDSIFRDEELFSVLSALLSPLSTINFNVDPFSPELNQVPMWLEARFEAMAKMKIQESMNVASNGRRHSYSVSSVPKGTSEALRRGRARSMTDDGSSYWGKLDSIYSGLVGAVDTVAATYLTTPDEQESTDVDPMTLGVPGARSVLADSTERRTEGFFGLRTKLYGTSLQKLLLCDQRCKYARLDPHVGMPNMVHQMIKALERNIDTPDLFRRRGSHHELILLRDSLEAERGIPEMTKIHTVSHCFLQWLYELPEPLFGFDQFDAFLMCLQLDGESDRIRNLQLLIDEIVWYNQTVVVAVVNLLALALRPEHSAKNGLNMASIIVISAPFFFRDGRFKAVSPSNQYQPGVGARNKVMDKQAFMEMKMLEWNCLYSVITAGSLVEFIIEHSEAVTKHLSESLELRSTWLNEKIRRVGYMQQHAEKNKLLMKEVSKFLQSLTEDQAKTVRARHYALENHAIMAQLNARRRDVASGDGLLRTSAAGLMVPCDATIAAYSTDEAVQSSISIVEELWRQLERPHRDMIRNRWKLYASSANDKPLLIKSVLETHRERHNSLSSVESDDFETNRISISRKTSNKKMEVSKKDIQASNGCTEENADDARMSLQGSSGAMLSRNDSFWQEGVTEETNVNVGHFGEYDGQRKSNEAIHRIDPLKALQGEAGVEEDEVIESKDIVVLKGEEEGPREHFEEALDEGWGNRGKKASGISVLVRDNRSLISHKFRDEKRFAEYSRKQLESELDKSSFSEAEKDAELQEPVLVDEDISAIFLEYDISKMLTENTSEFDRWKICGFAGKAAQQAGNSATSFPTVPSKDLASTDGQLQPGPSKKDALIDLLDEHGEPLEVFSKHEYGAIAAELLLRFLQRFGNKADLLVCEFARKRIKYCSLPMVCVRLAQITLWVLRLSPTSKPSYLRSKSSVNLKSLQSFNEDKIFEGSKTYNLSPSEFEGEASPKGDAQGEDTSFIEADPVLIDAETACTAEGKEGTGPPKPSAADTEAPPSPDIPRAESTVWRDTEGDAILSAELLAKEPSWALLSSEYCVQEVFDISLRMFDDIWQHLETNEACGMCYDNEPLPVARDRSESQAHVVKIVAEMARQKFDPFSFCLDVVKTLMAEIIETKPLTVEQLWRQWNEVRTSRQEIYYESRILLKLQELAKEVGAESFGFDDGTLGGGGAAILHSLSRLMEPMSSSQSIFAGITEAGNVPKSLDSELIVNMTAQEQYKAIMGDIDKSKFDQLPPLKIYGDSQILSAEHIKQLRNKLPATYQLSDWRLKYRLSSDGASLTTMRQLSADCETMLIVMMNSRNDVFGGLVTDAWRPTLGRSYYGTGSCLVWTFYQGETLHMYPATGVNDYYILTCDKYFAMGSGGNFAIYIDAELRDGCSGPCETFGSPSLCSKEEFECVAMEVYSLESSLMRGSSYR